MLRATAWELAGHQLVGGDNFFFNLHHLSFLGFSFFLPVFSIIIIIIIVFFSTHEFSHVYTSDSLSSHKGKGLGKWLCFYLFPGVKCWQY